MPRRKKDLLSLKTYDDEKLLKECSVANIDHSPSISLAARNTYKSELSPFGQFPRLNECSAPFEYCNGHRFIHARTAICLALKAYWNFALLRNIVEVQVELSNSKLFQRGSNKRTRDFISNWWKKIRIEKLKEEWFREYFRSANPITFRYDGRFTDEGIELLRKGGFAQASKTDIPLRYEILNPETIVCLNGLTLGKRIYYQQIPQWKLNRLKNPVSADDKEFVNQLTPKSKEDLKKTSSGGYIELDPDKVTNHPYKAQDYEPFGIPMAFGVLNDIESKLELKRIDMSIARTVDRAFLLINVGESPTKDNAGLINVEKRIQGLQEVLSNEAIARTIITDWTVKAEWLIPDIDKILGEEKYKQLDKDINQGLNAIIFDTGEKFANTSVKVKVFIERLKEARNNFLDFLNAEIERVCNAIGAKSTPEVYFEELDLKDELQYQKLVLTMYQSGLLTAEEAFEGMELGKIPDFEDSKLSQDEFKQLKEQGYYMPLVGGSSELQKQQLSVTKELGIQQNQIKQQQVKQAGRPSGTKSPQSTKRQTPIGGNIGFSLSKICDKLPKAHSLLSKAESILKEKYKVKKLKNEHKTLAHYAVEALITNELEADWDSKLESYALENKEVDQSKLEDVQKIQAAFNCDSFTAAILNLTVTELQDE